MSEQHTFAGIAWTTKGKLTRRERFLTEMDQVIPWKRLIALIEPHYPKPGRGRRPLGLEKMLRIYVLQQWFDLSDPGAEDAIYDSESMRRFVGIELGEDKVPDESSILLFRHLLERHQLTKAIFEEIGELLKEKGLMLRQGTIVDATIISAPSSTKNREGKRDPEMRQTKKGNQWHFGMKAHIGVDEESGLVHHVECTAANVNDVTQVHKLLHGKEDTICGDSGYTGANKREELQDVDAAFWIAEKPSKLRAMKNKRERGYAERWEHFKASVRAKVEHPFRVVKRQFGYTKVRYRGLAKNTAQVVTLFALSNLWMARRRLLQPAG